MSVGEKGVIHRPLYKKAKKVHAKNSNMAEIVVDSLYLFVLWKLSFSMIKLN